MFALQYGGSTNSWSAYKVIGLLVTFAVLFAAFIVVEILTPQTAMAPTRVVLNRSVAGTMLFMFLNSGALMSVLYYLTIWFQVAKGASAIHAGVNTIPLVLSFLILGVGAAVCTQKLRYYNPALLLAPVFTSIAAGLLSTLTANSGRSAWIGYQVLYGIGVGFGFQNSNLPVQTILPRVDVPLGMALMFFMQQLGGSVFLAVSQNLFSSRLVDQISHIAGLDAGQILNTGLTDAAALRKIVPESQLEDVVDVYSRALTRVFILAAALSATMILCALALDWRKIPGKAEGMDSSEGHDVDSAGETEKPN